MNTKTEIFGTALGDDDLNLVSGGAPSAGSVLGTLAKGALRVAVGPVALVAQILFTPSKLGDGTLKGNQGKQPAPPPKK